MTQGIAPEAASLASGRDGPVGVVRKGPRGAAGNTTPTGPHAAERMVLTPILLADIYPDPDNVRDDAADADIDALAADIAKRGLLQPLIVYPRPEGGFLLSGGHRRWHALHQLGVTETDAYVRTAPGDDLERLDLMGSENLHRRQLNPVEEAKFYRRYLNAGLTQQQVAERVGTHQTRVSQLVSLLELSADVQRRVVAGELTVAAALRVVRAARADRGTARADVGGQHGTSLRVPHFTSAHPLRPTAAYRCERAGHDQALKLGGACGPCWERAIRTDAGQPAAPAGPPPQGGGRQVEVFTDPREILRRLRCRRCGSPALARDQQPRCITVRGAKRVMFDHHEFPVQVTAPLVGVGK